MMPNHEIKNENLGDVVTDTIKVGREIVAFRVTIIAIITIVVNLGVGYGWFGPAVQADVLKYLTGIFDAISAVVTVLAVRPAVTPVRDPRNNDGEKLVPVSTTLNVGVTVHPPTGEADAPPTTSTVDTTGKEVLPIIPPVDGPTSTVAAPPHGNTDK